MPRRRPFRSVDLADSPISTTASLAEAESLRMFLQACFGALIGVIAAMAIAHIAFPPDGPAMSVPSGLLPEVLPSLRVEPREKGFYLLSLLLGFLGGILATSRLLKSRILCSVLGLVLATTIPLDTAVARRTLQGHLPAPVGFSTALILALGLTATLLAFKIDSRRRLVSETRINSSPFWSFWIYGVLLAALTLIVLPSSLETVAAHIGLRFSYVSFIIGPALYFLGNGLLPGVDYYAQYGVGLGWLFSLILGRSTQEALLNYVTLVIIAIWLFYAHLLYILHWLYRSWFASAIVSFLSLILLFHTEVHFEDPSSTVLRYPLLTVCAALLARWVSAPAYWPAVFELAFAVAGALFLETETGIIAAIAVMLGFVIVSPWRLVTLLRLASVGVASLIFLLLMLFIVFGRGALTSQFVLGWLEPLEIYGIAGLGGWPIFWTLKDWNWLYNFVAPGSALATLSVAIRYGRQSALDRPRTAVLVYFAVSGLLMMAKFINMSIVAVWQMNALGLLVVMGWWCVAAVRRVPWIVCADKLPIRARTIAALAMLAPAATLAATSSDSRNPTDYGVQSWLKYPALALAPFREAVGCKTLKCVTNFPNPRDVALVQHLTAPGVPVAIVGGLYDWTYLIDAHRPPAMSFLPSFATFTKRQLGASLTSLARVDYCFLFLGPGGVPSIPNASLSAALLPILEQDFVLDRVGQNLGAWKRRHHEDDRIDPK